MKCSVTPDGDLKLLFGLSDLGTALGWTPAYIWQKVYQSGTIPEPTHLEGRRYYYCEADFREIVAAEKKAEKKKPSAKISQ